jgi:hypothetical protein
VAYDSANVRVLRAGTLYRAPVGTAAPTNATTALNAAFVDLGGIGEDGLTEERERDSEQIRYDNGDLAREVVTESALTLNATLIETTRAGLEAYYGATGTVTGDELAIDIDPASTGGRFAWVYNAVDGAVIRRTYIPSGEVTEVGELTFVGGEPWGYEITITGYKVDGNAWAARAWVDGLDLA